MTGRECRLGADHFRLGLLEGIRNKGVSSRSPVVGMMMSADDGTAASFAIAEVLCKPIEVLTFAATVRACLPD